MAVSSFDPNVFLSQELTSANETTYTPIPPGEYQAYIDDIAMDEYEEQPILIVTYALLDETLKTTLGLEKPTIRDRLFLDTNEDGTIAFGTNKNVKLGRTREAVGQNNAKKPWNFNMLRNAGPVMVLVTHSPGKNPGEVYSNVARVAKAA